MGCVDPARCRKLSTDRAAALPMPYGSPWLAAPDWPCAPAGRPPCCCMAAVNKQMASGLRESTMRVVARRLDLGLGVLSKKHLASVAPP